MGSIDETVPEGSAAEESAFLSLMIQRFDHGVTEGHLHTLLYVGQKLRLIPVRYEFQFQHLVPFCEDLDLKVAMLLWSNSICIQDNRIRAVRPPPPGRKGVWAVDVSCLDKLFALSYDALKFLSVMLHLEQDLQKSRPEAIKQAVRLFPIQEDQARKLVQNCSV